MPEKSGSGRSPADHLPVTAGFVSGALAVLVAYRIVRDLKAALAWGAAAGSLVAAADPRPFLGSAVFFLLLPPIALVLDFDPLAENLARTAFTFLALGVALELRQDLGRRGRRDGERRVE